MTSFAIGLSADIVFASCGAHRIPFNKTYPCLAMEARLFVFALPGIMLGLQLWSDADQEEVDVLEGILSEHCNFRKKEMKAPAPASQDRALPVPVAPAPVMAPKSPTLGRRCRYSRYLGCQRN